MSKIEISITRTQKPKAKPDVNDLGFGKYFSDHMFLVNYNEQKGWHNPRITPYQSLDLDPGASALHYGQALFEGMKAFKQESGEIVLFRPEFNWQRMTNGAERLCMLAPPKEIFLEGIKKLVEIDQDWIPTAQGSSLYIRPTLIGSEAFLGVRPAQEFIFYVLLSPVGSYYSGGLQPLKIWVEKEYLRAAPGGLGATKAAANYAGSLKAALEAKKKGYSQVLWLDVKKEYIEEVGTMNIFFVFENEIVTPALDGTILAGGVRDSVLTILKSWKKNISERKVSIQEIRTASANGQLKEIFGVGTAAVISPVGELAAADWKINLNDKEMGPIAAKLYDEILGIQRGLKPDEFNWLQKLN